MDIEEIRQQFFCATCGYDTSGNEYYMIHDELWEKTGAGDAMLCIGCCEQKLGRQLNRDDFTEAPINWISNHSPRLRDRLSKVAHA
jgi:hypothetical protein